MRSAARTIPRLETNGSIAMRTGVPSPVVIDRTPPSPGRCGSATRCTLPRARSGATARKPRELSWLPAITATAAPVRARASNASYTTCSDSGEGVAESNRSPATSTTSTSWDAAMSAISASTARCSSARDAPRIALPTCQSEVCRSVTGTPLDATAASGDARGGWAVLRWIGQGGADVACGQPLAQRVLVGLLRLGRWLGRRHRPRLAGDDPTVAVGEHQAVGDQWVAADAELAVVVSPVAAGAEGDEAVVVGAAAVGPVVEVVEVEVAAGAAPRDAAGLVALEDEAAGALRWRALRAAHRDRVGAVSEHRGEGAVARQVLADGGRDGTAVGPPCQDRSTGIDEDVDPEALSAGGELGVERSAGDV